MPLDSERRRGQLPSRIASGKRQCTKELARLGPGNSDRRRRFIHALGRGSAYHAHHTQARIPPAADVTEPVFRGDPLNCAILERADMRKAGHVRLGAAGKAPKQAITAVMGKLIVLANALLKNKRRGR
jgi:hypothetical protein